MATCCYFLLFYNEELKIQRSAGVPVVTSSAKSASFRLPTLRAGKGLVGRTGMGVSG